MRHPVISGCLAAAFAVATAQADDRDDRGVRTATPIKHLVVIFQENISYDHYFGTYPQAQNNPGETPFKASKHTPINNNLLTPLDGDHGFKPLVGLNLLTNNPNSNPNAPIAPIAPNSQRHNGADASNPFRLSPNQASTADQGHNDMPEQAAYNNGNMDGFPAWVGTAGGTAANGPLPPPAAVATKGLVMGYYDGNTITALWNYAQHYAMSDNSFSSQFGPSSPGALNLISGQANGFSHATNVQDATGKLLHPTHKAFGDASHTTSNITMIGDADPEMDACSNPTIDQTTMLGRNIGDLLNARNITWGWFEGGFNLCRPSTRTAAPAAHGSLCRPSRISRSPRPTTSRTTSRSSTTPRRATQPTRGQARSRRSGRPASQIPTRPILRTTSTTRTTSLPRSMPATLPR
jgi:phospholipase C